MTDGIGAAETAGYTVRHKNELTQICSEQG